MIRSFGDNRTRQLYNGERVRGFPEDVLRTARRKLDMLKNTNSLAMLRVPPGNHLEALKGQWDGFHSIRVNAQWRIVFRWRDGGAEDVRMVDYH